MMKQLREGFTTGSCAAACALASCLWQKEGECPPCVTVILPGGREYYAQIHSPAPYTCAVFKDAGDDPDITNGSEVWATVTLGTVPGEITFKAGEGVGVITLPGLKLPAGEAAINPVPREMIKSAVRLVYPDLAAEVTVGITGGRELAKKTFNPRLGIEGGLSVLGTTGIVRPMSEESLVETIRLELQFHRTAGSQEIAMVFGSQGEKAVKALYPDRTCVQISNFVGAALDSAAEFGYSRVLLAGQPGKLVKVAGGSMQTHSKYGDGRRETLCAHLSLMGAPAFLLQTVMESITLDGMIPVIHDAGFDEVWNNLCHSASRYASTRSGDALPVDTLMLDSRGHIIGGYQHE